MDLQYLQWLQVSFTRIDPLIRDAVFRAQQAGHDPTDAMRGLIISDDEVQAHLSKPVLAGLWTEEDADLQLPLFEDKDGDTPLLHLMKIFQLTPLDVSILLLALAPEVDRRYERLYGYLQDDVSLRYPTVNLLMNILGTNVPQRFSVWDRLAEHMPLRSNHLLELTPNKNGAGTFLASQVKVDFRISAHLLGDRIPDTRILRAVERISSTPVTVLPPVLTPIVMQAFKQSPILFFEGDLENGQQEAAMALCYDYRLQLVQVDLQILKQLELSFDLAWHLALREASLTNSALMLLHWETCLDERDRQPPKALWDALKNYDLPVFICGSEPWETLDKVRKRRILRLKFEKPEYDVRYQTWLRLMDEHRITAPDDDIRQLSNKFRFNVTQIQRVVQTAQDIATGRGEQVSVDDLYMGSQAHANLRLSQYAERVYPRHDWGDLILPAEQMEQLKEIEARARCVHIVQDEWGFGKKTDPVPGVSALFAGESGTGKTLAAEVIAKGLGLVMYRIDLAAVVSKYIGETEKNLSAIFKEARTNNAILFFDEADAIFGKRSEVKDARDRYANIEIAYLLQEIESYSGIAILATNLRQNLDDAFTRRLDFLIDFPFPENEYRHRIWQVHFPPQAPLAPDVDLRKVAEHYHLAGGNIKNAAVAAAYLAADEGSIITKSHLTRAIRREHQKMGRLLNEV